MKDWVNKNVYAEYQPRKYVRTYQLLNAITLSDIKIINTSEGTEVEFEVYFDSAKMHHTSVVSKTEYWKGQRINVPYFINYGHHHPTKLEPAMFNQYPARHFIEDMMKEFKKKVEERFTRKITIMINKVGDYIYRR
jgi:hypothetical protein